MEVKVVNNQVEKSMRELKRLLIREGLSIGVFGLKMKKLLRFIMEMQKMILVM